MRGKAQRDGHPLDGSKLRSNFSPFVDQFPRSFPQQICNKSVTSWQLPRLRGSYRETYLMSLGISKHLE